MYCLGGNKKTHIFFLEKTFKLWPKCGFKWLCFPRITVSIFYTISPRVIPPWSYVVYGGDKNRLALLSNPFHLLLKYYLNNSVWTKYDEPKLQYGIGENVIIMKTWGSLWKSVDNWHEVKVGRYMPGWVRLLLNANSAIFQLYRGKNKLIFNEMMMRFALN